MIDAAQRVDDALFVEYWGESCEPDRRIERWLALADGYARGTGWLPSNSLFGEFLRQRQRQRRATKH